MNLNYKMNIKIFIILKVQDRMILNMQKKYLEIVLMIYKNIFYNINILKKEIVKKLKKILILDMKIYVKKI